MTQHENKKTIHTRIEKGNREKPYMAKL